MKLKKFQQFNEDVDMDMHHNIEHDVDRDNSSNYMFFENLRTLQRLVEELLTLDETEVDEIIESGHDWAADHISVAKADVEQVYEFLMNNSDSDNMEHDMDTHVENDLDEVDDMDNETEDFQSNPMTDETEEL